MTVRIIDDPPAPGTEAWRKMITASKIPAIMGLSPWQTPYSLWHEMHGDAEPKEPTPAQKRIFQWGHSAELAMADYWAKENPEWELSEGEVAFTDDSLPFPNLVTVDRVATHKETGDQRILELKTVNSFDALAKWGKEGDIDSPPLNYRVQHLMQRGVSHIHDGEMMVQGMGAPEFHKVSWKPLEWARILQAATAFNRMLEAGTPPPLDGEKITYDIVRGLHPDIERDTIYVGTAEQARALFAAKRAEEEAAFTYRALRAELVDQMGDRHRAVAGDIVFARRQASGKSPVPNLVLVGKAEEELKEANNGSE